ncbi:hypothetical protein K456DRAFT_35639 [Colletotrichum gloeosporioides 23]|nr:hypothetical protein K456DRAFT_35639 [Colletotrichum gloeosporioides 23]
MATDPYCCCRGNATTPRAKQTPKNSVVLEDYSVALNLSVAITGPLVRYPNIFCVDITPSDLFTTAFIEAWISHISEVADAYDVFDNPIDESFEAFNLKSSRTPSPSKKRKPSADADAEIDLDATPRPSGIGTISFTDRLRATASLDSSSISTQTDIGPGTSGANFFTNCVLATASSLDDGLVTTPTTSDVVSVSDVSNAPSGVTSAKNCEGELRRAPDYPLRREDGDRWDLTPLIEELIEITSGPVFPHSVKRHLADLWLLKNCMRCDASWKGKGMFNNAWFYAEMPGTKNEVAIDMDIYIYMRIWRIVKNTALCATTMEHEAGWNDMVYSQLLELVVADESSFCEKDERISNAKVDYAIVLTLNAFKILLDLVVHVNLLGPKTLVAVSIETKSANAEPLLGWVQLATWAWAYFR